MNHQTFFDAIRPSFGKISTPQMAGMQALLDEGAGLTLHHMANVLAQVRRETGGYMSPIKETVMPYHKDKNPSDATVIARLDKAWAAGKLGKVKKPYWRDGEFGRGQIQLTHAANRKKFGITNRDDLLKLPVSARVAVVGMRDGVFTGKKLSDYDFPAALDAPPAMNPRRIVNGQDGSDKEVAKFHREFAAALTAAGWRGAAQDHPYVTNTPGIAHKPPPYVIETPEAEHVQKMHELPAIKPTTKPVVVTEPAPQAPQDGSVQKRTDQNPIKKPANPPGEPLERGGGSGGILWFIGGGIVMTGVAAWESIREWFAALF